MVFSFRFFYFFLFVYCSLFLFWYFSEFLLHEPRILSTGLLGRSGPTAYSGQPVLRVSVPLEEKAVEGSGVKPLFLCVKIFVTFFTTI